MEPTLSLGYPSYRGRPHTVTMHPAGTPSHCHDTPCRTPSHCHDAPCREAGRTESTLHYEHPHLKALHYYLIAPTLSHYLIAPTLSHYLIAPTLSHCLGVRPPCLGCLGFSHCMDAVGVMVMHDMIYCLGFSHSFCPLP